MSLEHALAIVGAVVPVASLVASVLNQRIRNAQAGGVAVAPWILTFAAGLNAVAMNGDKAVQALKLAKGGKQS
jgi:hypothetical protein